MTVRLLVPAVGKQANALYTSTALAERALIDAGQADRNLDASFEYQTLFGPSSWLAPPVTSGPSLSLSTSTVATGVTGNVSQLASSLSGNVTYSKVSGAASVAVSSVGAVTLSSGLTNGATATFIGRGQNDAGDAIERSLTLTGVSSGVTPTPTPTPTPAALQAIGTDGAWQAGLGSVATASTTMQIFRSVVTTGQAPVSSITFTASAIRGADLTTSPFVLRADMEYNGVCVPCTWNGATSISLAGTENDFLPDEMPASAFGVSTIPAAASIAVKLERTIAVGADSVYTYSGPKTGEYSYRAAAGTQSLIGVPGATPTVPSGYATYSVIWRPVLLLGRPTTKMPAIGMFGASIEFGYYATTNDLGYTNAANSAPKYAYGNFARIGESASNFAVGTKRSAYMKYFNICYNGYGGNDFSNNSTTAVAIAALKQVNAMLKSAGAKIVIHIRMSPKSDSTNNWIDQAGQTVRTTTGGVGFVDYRAQVDAAMAADTNLAGQFDPNGVFESAGFPGTWKYNGTPKYWVEDGTHPNNPAHQAQIPVFRAEVDNRINAYLSA